jgi:hypothetical protein
MSRGYEFDLTRLRIPGCALLVGGLALAHLPEGLGIPCPLRTLTGVPCPFCGTTTAIRDAGGGHLRSAVSAAPLGLGAVVIAIVAVLGILPKKLTISPVAILLILSAEWTFELFRFRAI